jgi:hypothetical protein
MATKSKKTVKKTVKKVSKKTSDKMTGEGYKGHRPGTMKEKLHQIFDKFGDKDLEKAKTEAKKTKASPATINTSFSQFRTGAV